MSGFAACFNRDFSPVDPLMLTVMSEFMGYRGNPVQPRYPTPFMGLCAAENTALADAHCAIIGDIRLDDRQTLIAHLQAFGHAVSALSSDLELVRCGYQTWQTQVTKYLYGDFSFAIWDHAKKSLFCARDHFGIKPLYYAINRDAVVVSNTQHALHFHPLSTRQLSPHVVAEHLLLGYYADAHTTLYKDISRLPPAHSLTVTPDQHHIERYWSLPLNEVPPRKTEQVYIDEFSTLFYEAVKDRMPPGRVGIHMSGGLDSTSVAVFMKRVLKDQNRPQDLTALTMILDDTDVEKKYALLAADHLGLKQVVFNLEHYRPFSNYENRRLRFLAHPGFDNNQGRHLRFNELAELVSSRVFTGHLGDAIFMRTRMYFGQLIAQKQFRKIAEELPRYYKAFGTRPALNLRWLAGEKRGNAHEFLEAEAVFPKWIRMDIIQKYHLDMRWYDEMFNRFTAFPSLNLERHDALLALGYLHSSNYYELIDPGSAGSALDTVHPFLDMRIVKFSLNLPNNPFNYQKRLLRKILNGILPEEIVNRPKTLQSTHYWKRELDAFLGPGSEIFDRNPFIWDFIDRARFKAVYPRQSDNEDRFLYLTHLRPANFMLWFLHQVDLLSEIDLVKRKAKV